MKTIETIIAQPQTKDQITALLAFMKALSIKFDTTLDKPYNREFVQHVLESQKQIAQGKVTRVDSNNINEFLGL